VNETLMDSGKEVRETDDGELGVVVNKTELILVDASEFPRAFTD